MILFCCEIYSQAKQQQSKFRMVITNMNDVSECSDTDSLLPQLKSSSRTSRLHTAPDKFSNERFQCIIGLGDKVEGNVHGTGTWLPGTVKRERHEGTFDIVYTNGDIEVCKPSTEIRLVSFDMTRKEKMKVLPICPNKHYFADEHIINNSSICFMSCDCQTIPETCEVCGFITNHLICSHTSSSSTYVDTAECCIVK